MASTTSKQLVRKLLQSTNEDIVPPLHEDPHGQAKKVARKHDNQQKVANGAISRTGQVESSVMSEERLLQQHLVSIRRNDRLMAKATSKIISQAKERMNHERSLQKKFSSKRVSEVVTRKALSSTTTALPLSAGRSASAQAMKPKRIPTFSEKRYENQKKKSMLRKVAAQLKKLDDRKQKKERKQSAPTR